METVLAESKGEGARKSKAKACQALPAAGSSGAPAAERDFEAMNKAELRIAAKELGLRQHGFSVAEIKDACKRAAGAAAKEACEEAELEAGSSEAPTTERDFDAMNRAELRTAAKEVCVLQNGVSVAELKAACKRAAWEQHSQKTLTAWMVGNARVAESVVAPPDSKSEHSGAGAVLGVARQALPAARKRMAVKPTWLRSKGRLAKRRQKQTTPDYKAKRRQEKATPEFKAKRRQ